ncbi:hypothetical protein B0H10DRAFT_1879625 [Mycena sp. CBHHK59/15]|nr:hypothetical protein B0H10DRAFT_1879625 [Mycena sp. CBHHK59/15]
MYSPPKPPRNRNIADLNIPWAPSSTSSLCDDGKLDPQDVPASPHSPSQRRCNPVYRAELRIGQILRTLRRFLFPALPPVKGETQLEVTKYVKEIKPGPPTPLSKWQEYGFYSRPTVNGVNVHNTLTPSPTPYRHIDLNEVDIHEIFANLRSPAGHRYPERWVRGLQHPALPPRPKGWDLPREGEPLPFPWECELNPFLAHAICGAAPLYWQIGQHDLYMYGYTKFAQLLLETELAEPATCPLLTHMYINAIADEDFRWPIMVANHRGIKIKDVFDAIWANFQQYVSQDEYQTWSPARRRRSELEYEIRDGAKTNDGLRRIDYLCGQVYFRGLAPNPNREGWMLFLGPEW